MEKAAVTGGLLLERQNRRGVHSIVAVAAAAVVEIKAALVEVTGAGIVRSGVGAAVIQQALAATAAGVAARGGRASHVVEAGLAGKVAARDAAAAPGRRSTAAPARIRIESGMRPALVPHHAADTAQEQ